MPKRLVPQIGTSAPEIGSRVWRLRDIELDERLLELRIGGVAVRAEPKPLGALMVLMRNADRIVSAQELGAMVWGGRNINEQVVTQCIARLRRSLGLQHYDLIRTVHGCGYRLAVLPEGVKPAARNVAREYRAGGDHPLRSGWKLIEPAPSIWAESWIAEHPESGQRRILLPLRRSTDVERAAREVAQYNDAVHGGRLDGLVCHALDWNFLSARGPCFIEYPANLHSLPDWIESRGGFSRVSTAERLELLAAVCERLVAAHVQAVRFGNLNPAAVLLGNRGTQEPLAYLPAALQGVDPLCARLYCRNWHGHEALYVAPEVRRGGAATPQSDAYSVGMMLFQLLAADWALLPTPGWELRIANARCRRLLAQLLHFDPAERPRQMDRLAAELRAHAQHSDLNPDPRAMVAA